MLSRSTIGTAANNMGQESFYKWLKAACGSKKNSSLNHFLGLLKSYMEDRANLEFSNVRDDLKTCMTVRDGAESLDPAVIRPFAYPSIPKITAKLWDEVGRLELDMMLGISIDGPRGPTGPEARFFNHVERVTADFLESKQHHGIITLSDIWPYYLKSIVTFNPTTDLRRVVMPTKHYVQHVRDKYSDWEAKIAAQAALFVQACVDGVHETKLGLKQYLRLMEDFVLLEALAAKWSLHVRHKCSCPHFFMKGVCAHVVLLAMIADPTRVVIPDDSDLSLIRSRAGKKRGRPAGQADSDSMDERRKKPKDRQSEKEPVLRDGKLPDSDEESEVISFIRYQRKNSNWCMSQESERESEPEKESETAKESELEPVSEGRQKR